MARKVDEEVFWRCHSLYLEGVRFNVEGHRNCGQSILRLYFRPGSCYLDERRQVFQDRFFLVDMGSAVQEVEILSLLLC